MKLNKDDKELIEVAQKVALDNADIGNTMNIVVACAVKGKSGNIYKGVNIMTSHSICAEQVAIGQGFACGERDFDTIVSIKLGNNGKCRVVSPCGLCRYTFDKLGLSNLQVIVADVKNDTITKVRANELLPYPYSRD